MKRPLRSLLALMSLVGLLLSGSAHAQSCGTLVQDRMNWVARGSGYYLSLRGTSLNAVQGQGYGLVSYVEGHLDQYRASSLLYDFTTGRWVTIPAQVSSRANSQSFSDRRAGSQPFNIAARDQLGITLDGNGKITITFDSWGGGALTVTPTSCANEVIYGFSGDGTLWAFALKKDWIG